MTLLTRLTRLFRADVHAVLDSIEEPEVLLRQAIREMEEALENDVRSIRNMEWERQQLTACSTEMNSGLSAIDAEIDLCFAANKETLVRALIRRKLEMQHQLRSVNSKLTNIEEEQSRLNKHVAEKQACLNKIRQQAEMVSAQDKKGAERNFRTSPETSIGDEDIEIALLREKQKRGLS
jgi:phage shock protein A